MRIIQPRLVSCWTCQPSRSRGALVIRHSDPSLSTYRILVMFNSKPGLALSQTPRKIALSQTFENCRRMRLPFVLLIAMLAAGCSFGQTASAGPGDQVAAARRSLAHATGITIRLTTPAGVRASLVWSASGAHAVIGSPPMSGVESIVVGGSQYLNGPATLFNNLPPAAPALAGRWVKLGTVAKVESPLWVPDLGQMADCLIPRYPKFSAAASSGGTNEVEARDGSGQLMARLFMSATIPEHILRIDQVRAAGSCSSLVGPLGAAANVDYEFSWEAPPVAAPGESVDLADKPYCGLDLDTRLSAAAQAYLSAVFDENALLMDIHGADTSCGCYRAWGDLQTDADLEVQADEAFVRGLAKISDPAVIGDVHVLIAAVNSVDTVLRAAIASGSISGFKAHSASLEAAKSARSTASRKVRDDLALPASPCSFRVP